MLNEWIKIICHKIKWDSQGSNSYHWIIKSSLLPTLPLASAFSFVGWVLFSFKVHIFLDDLWIISSKSFTVLVKNRFLDPILYLLPPKYLRTHPLTILKPKYCSCFEKVRQLSYCMQYFLLTSCMHIYIIRFSNMLPKWIIPLDFIKNF